MRLEAFVAFSRTGWRLLHAAVSFFPRPALFCNDLMEELELNPATRIMWKSVKPLLMGQVLYAPDSPAVRQIVKNVSHMTKVFHRLCSICFFGKRSGLISLSQLFL